MDCILDILYGRNIHKNYRIQIIDNWRRWNNENKENKENKKEIKCLFKI